MTVNYRIECANTLSSVVANQSDRTAYSISLESAALIVPAAVLTFHDRPYEIPALAVAAGCLLVYLVGIE